MGGIIEENDSFEGLLLPRKDPSVVCNKFGYFSTCQANKLGEIRVEFQQFVLSLLGKF